MEPDPTALPFSAEQEELRALYAIYVSLSSLGRRGSTYDPRAALRLIVRETRPGEVRFLDVENIRTAEIVGGWYAGVNRNLPYTHRGPTDAAVVESLMSNVRENVCESIASATREADSLDVEIRQATERLRAITETIAAAKLALARLGASGETT